MMKGLKKLGSAMGKGVSTATSTVRSAATDMGHAIGDNVVKPTGAGMKTMGSEIGKGMHTVGSTVKEGTKEIGHITHMDKAAESMGKGMQSVGSTVKESAADLGKKTYLDKAATFTKSTAGSIASATGLDKLSMPFSTKPRVEDLPTPVPEEEEVEEGGTEPVPDAESVATVDEGTITQEVPGTGVQPSFIATRTHKAATEYGVLSFLMAVWVAVMTELLSVAVGVFWFLGGQKLLAMAEGNWESDEVVSPDQKLGGSTKLAGSSRFIYYPVYDGEGSAPASDDEGHQYGSQRYIYHPSTYSDAGAASDAEPSAVPPSSYPSTMRAANPFAPTPAASMRISSSSAVNPFGPSASIAPSTAPNPFA